MKNTDASIRNEVQGLEEIFDRLNKKLYDGQLKRPVITVTPRPKLRHGFVLGWCTANPEWVSKETIEEFGEKKIDPNDGTEVISLGNVDAEFYEISVCGESLAAPIADIVETMAHEMVHLYNALAGIKDTSRGGTWHNKKYRDSAEEHGLTVEQSKRYGWNQTALNPEMVAFVESDLADIEMLMARMVRDPGKSAKAKKPFKYVCPICGAKFQSTKPVNAICGHETDEVTFVDDKGEVPLPTPFTCVFDPREDE